MQKLKTAANGKPWNFLWISFEDCSPMHGLYGHSVAQTPNVDAFSKEATVYPNAFSCTGVCAPTRASVITGMYPTSIGAQHMRTGHTDPDEPELPTPYQAFPQSYVKCFTERFRAAGYYCSNNKKTDYQFGNSVTAWDDCSDEAHWRNRDNKEQPFFAVFNPTLSHESQAWHLSDEDILVDLNDIEVPPIYPDTPEVRKALAKVYSQMKRADDIFGNIIKQLKEDGLYENTIIMHWSDHGPLPRGKRWIYDTGIKVPMIVRIPGQEDQGKWNDRLVSTMDLGPSLLSLAGIEIPTYIEGKAFLGQAMTEEREYTFHSRDRYDSSYDLVRAVRSKKYKYIVNYYPDSPRAIHVPFRNRHPIMKELFRLESLGQLPDTQRQMFESPRSVEELYDMEADPWETNNLASRPDLQSTLQGMREALKVWQKQSDPYIDVDEKAMVDSWYPEQAGKTRDERWTPQTAAPLALAFGENDNAQEALATSVTLKGACHLQLTCATQGASINFALMKDGQAKAEKIDWKLYSSFIPLKLGKWQLKAQSQRLGYDPSEISELEIEVV